MISSGSSKFCFLAALGCIAGTHAAVANPKISMPAAAPHSAAPAPRPPMAAPRAPIMTPHPAMAPTRFQAPARPAEAPASRGVRADNSTAHEPHFAHAARPAMAEAHAAGREAHPGREPAREEAHADMRRDAAHDAAGKAREQRELARDDPARAHGRFDEHVHDEARERDIMRLHEHDFHVRDVRYFNAHEWQRWRGGYWQRDTYNGRFGWWFDVGGIYYPYAAPIWPYPLSVAPLMADAAAAAPPPPADTPALPPLPHVAYHCARPSGFYPSVEACAAGWVTLAAH